MHISVKTRAFDMFEWYTKIGFDRDPFAKETGFEGHDSLVDEVFYAIHSGNMVSIVGESGSGKTKILREIIKRFGGKKKIIYVNCRHMQKSVNVENLLQNTQGFFKRILGKKPNRMILLLDEVESLTSKNCERIKYYFDQNYLQSVIFTGKTFPVEGMNQSLVQRISKVLRICPLSDYEAVRIIRDKIGGKYLSDRVIKTIYSMSGRNTGKLLQNCRTVMTEIACGKKEITEEEVEKLLLMEK